MTLTHVVGVDPGIIHTGVVRFLFDSSSRTVALLHNVVFNADAKAAAQWISNLLPPSPMPTVYIEDYRPRSHFDTDRRMSELIQELRLYLPRAEFLSNTGIKKVVKPELMQLLDVWSFSTITHHQDLRSAARIALLGMMKEEDTNRLLADIVRAHLEGDPWHVSS